MTSLTTHNDRKLVEVLDPAKISDVESAASIVAAMMDDSKADDPKAFRLPSLGQIRKDAPRTVEPECLALCQNEMMQQVLRTAGIIDLYLVAVTHPTELPPSLLRCGFWINPSTGCFEPRFSTMETMACALGMKPKRSKGKGKGTTRRAFGGRCSCKATFSGVDQCTKCACVQAGAMCDREKCGCNPSKCRNNRSKSPQVGDAGDAAGRAPGYDNPLVERVEVGEGEEKSGDHDVAILVQPALPILIDWAAGDGEVASIEEDEDDAGDSVDQDDTGEEDPEIARVSATGDEKPHTETLDEMPEWAPRNRMEFQYNWKGAWFTGVLTIPPGTLFGWSALYQNDNSEVSDHSCKDFESKDYGSKWVVFSA